MKASSAIFSAEGRFNTKLKRVEECKRNQHSINLPESYLHNTTKEELCAEYIQKFINQFLSINPKRKRPYMIAENEYGAMKFVCTTLRPTELQYTELYDMYECAIFLAGFILYEPLQIPTEPPHILPSPLQTLKWHTGDCFDIATVLCSFLIGCGYDAYVVNGYAPKFIALRDQSRTLCPLASSLAEVAPNETHDDDDNEEEKEENTYKPPNNTVRESKYLADQKERKRLEGLDSFILWASDESEADFKSADDSLRRVHAWVLVRAGRRDVKDHVFLEPSTGRAYQPASSPYVAIESIWNHANYWVNMNIDRKMSQVKENTTECLSVWMSFCTVRKYFLSNVCPSLLFSLDLTSDGFRPGWWKWLAMGICVHIWAQ